MSDKEILEKIKEYLELDMQYEDNYSYAKTLLQHIKQWEDNE